MNEGTLLSVSLGLLVAAGAGLLGAGITWGRLTSRFELLNASLEALRNAIRQLDKDGRGDIRAMHQRFHDLSSKVQDLELRTRLAERELGIPHVAREDRTPVQAMPVRPRLDTGPHDPTDG